MTAIPLKKYTLEEYFELDRNAEGNFEYFSGEVFEMSGVSVNHATIEMNLAEILNPIARKKGCRAFPANLKVKVPTIPPYRYPDLSVVCGQANFEEIGGLQALTNPILIIEVLSDSTEKFDRGEKFRQYKLIESFREYLLIEQNGKNVTLFQKHNDRFWLQSDYVEGESLKITTLDFDLSVNDLYRDVEFPAITE
jgi:Uma2 family endonuclease